MLDEPQDPLKADVVVPVGGVVPAVALLPDGEVGGVKSVVVFSIAQPVARVDASSRPATERAFMIVPYRLVSAHTDPPCMQVNLC